VSKTRIKKKQRPVRVGLISLGCAKNLVDAEIILGSLLQNGFEITNDARQAEVVIINTCSFIKAAQQESVETILESAQLRAHANRAQGLIVAGCLPQRFRAELPKLLPEVDAFMGVDQIRDAARIVREVAERRGFLEQKPSAAEHQPLLEITARPAFVPDYATPRFRLTPGHFAYVKIAEGCNHPCSFCIIPGIRGPHRSRRQADIIKEARQLIVDGVKELNLISQDSTYYGLDLHRNRLSSEKPARMAKSVSADVPTICTLVRELDRLEIGRAHV
jgi:ribosomal protein S12 methylthiotransferase